MNQDLNDWLKESFVDPIEKHGFDYKEYAHSALQDTGVHILRFEGDSSYIDDKLKQVLTQDDDNQPPATYQIYFGTLLVFIPYFA
tara:strand:- start:960 stop:1214 length:255 start_codon:yes stop_codon:yes gene_type:complete